MEFYEKITIQFNAAQNGMIAGNDVVGEQHKNDPPLQLKQNAVAAFGQEKERTIFGFFLFKWNNNKLNWKGASRTLIDFVAPEPKCLDQKDQQEQQGREYSGPSFGPADSAASFQVFY